MNVSFCKNSGRFLADAWKAEANRASFQ